MNRILTSMALLVITAFLGCRPAERGLGMTLPESFNIDAFDRMEVRQQERLINGLSTSGRKKLLGIILPGRGLGSEWGEARFFMDGEFIYDFFVDPEGMGGGNPGVVAPKYLVGHWKIEKNGMVLWKDKSMKEIEMIAEREVWSDYSANSYSDGALYLNFTILGRTKGQLGSEKSFQYLKEFGSTAIERYSVKKASQ